MMYGYGAGFGAGFGLLGGLLLVVGVVLLVVWLVGRSHVSSSTNGVRSAPLAILQERYARGEISEEEFERRKNVLGA